MKNIINNIMNSLSVIALDKLATQPGTIINYTATDGSLSLEGYLIATKAVARAEDVFLFGRFVAGKYCVCFYRLSSITDGGIFNATKDEKYPCKNCLAIAHNGFELDVLLVTLY